jgi:TolA-binding protein
MSEKKRSLMAVFVALLIIIVGLLLLCSQRAAVNQGQDLATDDDAFREELLEMLDLADDTGTDTAALSEFESQDEGTADEVLSLLAPETDQVTTLPDPVLAETTPTTTADNMGLSQDMFANVQRDVNRLESVLERSSQAVDSLRRIVENRNARIRELESRMVATPTGTYSPPAASRGTRPVSTAPVSSGFMSAYQNARQQFESYNYQAAISSFEGLLANNPNHQLADNCQYWIGEAYYGLKQYPKALLEFQKVFGYSQADKHDDAQLMIGMCYVKQGQGDKANQEFGTFLNTYSGSEYTSIAQRYYRSI